MVLYLLVCCKTISEYARRRRERRYHFRPADVAFCSSVSDKNVLIFHKVWCFNIHFDIHTCHQLKFDLGQSSTLYPFGLHKKSIHGRGPVFVGQLMFSREKLDRFPVCMRYAMICESRAHSAYKHNSQITQEALFTCT